VPHIVALALLLSAAPARAELTAFWRHNPITTAAIAADPQLAAMQSWSLMVTNTNGHWESAGLRATLPSGLHFYNTPPARRGGWTHPSPNDIAMFPDVEFDTYVSGPRNQSGAEAPAVFGPHPKNEPPFSFGGPTDPAPGTFSVAWGDPTGRQHPPGAYEFSRLTFPASVLPDVHAQSVVQFVVPDQMVLVPTTIPEPAAVACAVLLIVTPRLRPRAGRAPREVT
jgi:hypothetical protein